MSADEATTPVPSPEDEPSPDGDRKERAAAGVARFFRGQGRTLIVVVVVAIVGYAALAGPDRGGDGDDEPRATTTAPADAGATTVPGSSGATTAPGATEVTDPAPTSTLVPPDVEEDRPPVDLASPPAADDPVELARWWAGTYTSYVGAEPPADLVARLTDWTVPALLDELRALPLAVSYDPPLEIDGVTEVELPPAAGGGAPAGAHRLRVSVQAVDALVVYDMTLVQGSGGGWLVSEAARV
jgi:hypothetical protein